MKSRTLHTALVLSAGIVTGLLNGSYTPANAQQGGKAVAGTLTCRSAGSVGLIVGSKESLDCRFQSTSSRRSENYAGTITRIGIDIGVRGANTLVWTVLFSSAELPAGSLSGNYAGVSSDVSVGIGGGANLLVGGSQSAVSLQPLSVQGQTGLNVAAGVSGLTLRLAR
jgi:hypothetical protein